MPKSNHAHMKIRICIRNDQNERIRTWVTSRNALSKKKNGVSEQIQNDYMHIKGQSKSITRGKQIN